MSAVRVRGLVRQFGSARVLDGVDLDIAPGEFVALIGKSGSGKTTLLRMLAGLDMPGEGTIAMPPRRAVVFQEPRLLPWRRVWQNVAIGLDRDGRRRDGRRRDGRRRAVEALGEVALEHRLEAWPSTLSGGEAQRVGLARALVRAPELLLLDEPLGALDALTRLKMQRLVGELWMRHRCAVLLVTHDVDEALLLADRVVLLEAGRIVRSWDVGLRRPRVVSAPGFASLKGSLLAGLGMEEDTSPAPPGGSDRGSAIVERRQPLGHHRPQHARVDEA